jgi:uncharacterized protein
MGYIFSLLAVALAVFVSAAAFPEEKFEVKNDPQIIETLERETVTPKNNDIKTEEIRGQSIIVNNRTFNVIVRDTEELRQKGLSGMKELRDDEAMLFVFDSPNIYGIWMKEMLFSIDIVWLDEKGRIISMEKNASPNSYPKVFYPSAPSQYVLEFNSGTLENIGAQVGDSVDIRLTAKTRWEN